jgi:hypothetical protein
MCNPDDETPCVDREPSEEGEHGDARLHGQRNHDALNTVLRVCCEVSAILLSAAWDAIEMAAPYEEFAAEHRAQHVSPVIRWSAVVGDYSLVAAAVALLLGRPRVGAAIFGLGTASLAAGHVYEGNLLRGLRDLARHPIWGTRADFAVANATIMTALRS